MPKGQVKQKIDLNNADVEELANVKMIGRKRAEALVEYREENGPFEDLDDLKKVEGFNSALIKELRQSGAILGEEKEETESEGEEW